ncbi:hypothetical protein CE143_08125 [Photorhabdus luminescens]|uniref:Uncharacterized protein n=2 Tax=Photorhabdus TaxID=29487 RepID=A0A2S8Q2B5_9GAMM|nr:MULTISPECIES: hypothetical protein [Photorhabdus]PQQ26084.1 hypothetical protein C6H66_10620 [Photorhabdus hindustanensis]QXF33112.1 hypothetical protein B0X70_08205 [Photorhabdus akhurstii]UJD74909.1 hypothetical protein CE143_08125 [Photorhabdus luminescens]
MSYLDPLALSIRFGNRNNLGADKRWTDKPNPLRMLNQEQFTYIYEDSLHFLYGRYRFNPSNGHDSILTDMQVSKIKTGKYIDQYGHDEQYEVLGLLGGMGIFPLHSIFGTFRTEEIDLISYYFYIAAVLTENYSVHNRYFYQGYPMGPNNDEGLDYLLMWNAVDVIPPPYKPGLPRYFPLINGYILFPSATEAVVISNIPTDARFIRLEETGYRFPFTGEIATKTPYILTDKLRQQWDEEEEQGAPIDERGYFNEDDLWQYDEQQGDWVKWREA